MRLCACFGVSLDLIGPLNFVLSDGRLRRSGMDYMDLAAYILHNDFAAFWDHLPGRLILLTPHSSTDYDLFSFQPEDTLLLGRESMGVPDDIAARCHDRVRIPMVSGTRSINVALSGALVLGEALRQTNLFPGRGGGTL